jgi:hypothetical protein
MRQLAEAELMKLMKMRERAKFLPGTFPGKYTYSAA